MFFVFFTFRLIEISPTKAEIITSQRDFIKRYRTGIFFTLRCAAVICKQTLIQLEKICIYPADVKRFLSQIGTKDTSICKDSIQSFIQNKALDWAPKISKLQDNEGLEFDIAAYDYSDFSLNIITFG